MNIESENSHEIFDDRMVSTYPELFTQPFGGFAVGEGWYPIIESLCDQISAHIKFKNDQRDSWNRGNGCEPVTVSQVKEKFGSLRFYYDGGDPAIAGMVTMAEVWASHSCEECGSPGTRRGGGWIRTLCDHHEAERQAQMKKNFGDEA